jgi:sec-independent protein translocase protein TatA
LAFGDPLQWIIIGVVVVVIFLWGPQKIPELARGLGRAKREFESASKEASDMASAISKPSMPASSAAGMASYPAPERSADQVLIETARKLGIATEGKTRDQISQEIVDKAGAR